MIRMYKVTPSVPRSTPAEAILLHLPHNYMVFPTPINICKAFVDINRHTHAVSERPLEQAAIDAAPLG